jgi:hypothetical protein
MQKQSAVGPQFDRRLVAWNQVVALRIVDIRAKSILGPTMDGNEAVKVSKFGRGTA